MQIRGIADAIARAFCIFLQHAVVPGPVLSPPWQLECLGFCSVKNGCMTEQDGQPRGGGGGWVSQSDVCHQSSVSVFREDLCSHQLILKPSFCSAGHCELTLLCEGAVCSPGYPDQQCWASQTSPATLAANQPQPVQTSPGRTPCMQVSTSSACDHPIDS